MRKLIGKYVRQCCAEWRLVFLPMLILFIFMSSSAANFYRWVDSQGKVHYSSAVPAEAASSGHAQMDKQGAVVGRVDSKKEREAKINQKRLLELNALLTDEERYDRMVENIYPNREALEEHFGGQISMISTNVRLLEYHRKQIKNQLVELKSKLLKTENNNDRQIIRRTITQLESNLVDHDKAIEESRKEQIGISERMKRVLVTMKKRQKQGSGVDYQQEFDALIKKYCNCSCKK